VGSELSPAIVPPFVEGVGMVAQLPQAGGE